MMIEHLIFFWEITGHVGKPLCLPPSQIILIPSFLGVLKLLPVCLKEVVD